MCESATGGKWPESSARRHRLSLIGDNTGIDSDYAGDDRPGYLYADYLQGSLFTTANGYDGPGMNTGCDVYSISTYGIPESWKTEPSIQAHADTWAGWFEQNSPETETFIYFIDESSDFSSIETWAGWIAGNTGAGGRIMSLATMPVYEAVAQVPSLSIPASIATFGISDEWETAVTSCLSNPDKRFYIYNGIRPAQKIRDAHRYEPVRQRSLFY